MRSLTRITLLAGMGLVLSSCAPVTRMYDNLTGTTIDERCATRRVAIEGYDLLQRDITETEARLRADYEIFVNMFCGPEPLPAPE